MKLLLSAALLLITGVCQADGPNLRTVTEKFQDWTLVCVEKEGKKQCRVNQTLSNQNGETVAIINLVKKSIKEHLIEIVLPLLLNLTKHVNIAIDDKKQQKYSYNFCNNSACFVIADGIKGKSILRSFKGGNEGTIAVTPFSKEQVKFGFSLKGFSAAFKALN